MRPSLALLSLSILIAAAIPLRSSEAATEPETGGSSTVEIGKASQDSAVAEAAALEALKRMEQQQQEILLRIEATRSNSAAEIHRGQELLSNRLHQLETSVSEQSRVEREGQRKLNSIFLISITVLSVIALSGFITMALMMLRAVRRMSEVTTAAVAAINTHLLPNGMPVTPTLHPSTEDLLSSLKHVDTRLRQMEQKLLTHQP